MLFFAYENVELVAAFNNLCIYVDCLVSLVGGNEVSAAYVAGQIESLAKVNLNECKLVCNVCLGLGVFYGNVGCRSKGCNTCGELANAGVFSIDVSGLGSAYSIVVAVSAEVVIGTVKSGCPSLGFCVVNINGSACSVILNGEFTISVVVNGDVLLFFAYKDIELEAAFNGFYIYVDCLVCLVGGNEVSAAYFAGQIKSFAKSNLVKEELVSYAVLRSGNSRRNVEIFGCSINLNGEGSSFGSFAALNGSGQSELNLFIAKGDSELAIFNNESFVVDCPSDGNILIVFTSSGKSESGVFGDKLADRDSALFISNLFCIGLNNQFEVLEAINTHRNEVRSAAVQNENTGCVCLPTEVSFVSCIDGGLVICLQSGGEVGYVCTNVGSDFTNLELEVVRGAAKFLTCDFNVLHNYRKTYVVSERFACDNLIGDIKSFNSLLVAVNDSCGTALDFLHAIVRSYRTGNFNGHTNFDAEISNGVFIHLVGVVTAGCLGVSKEEVVAGVACCLGVDSNNNTLNNNGVTFFSSHVFLVAPKNVLRNGEVEGLGAGLTIGRGDGCCQNVCEFFFSFFVNVYGVGVIIFLGDGNLVGVNSPSNSVFCIFDSNYRSYFEVCTGNALVLIKVVNISNSSIDVVCGSNGGIVFGRGCFSIVKIGDNLLQEVARSKCAYAQNQCQQKYKNFFHCLFSFCFLFFYLIFAN